jgi:hypothetical protein
MMKEYADRVWAMLMSRRFQMLAGCILLLLMKEQFGLDESTVKQIQTVLIAWVIGESIRPSTPSEKELGGLELRK